MTNFIPAIENIIAKAQQACDELLLLLEFENRLLITGESSQLGEVAGNKTALLSQLTLHEAELSKELGLKDIKDRNKKQGNGKSDSQPLIDAIPKWTYFKDSLEKCRALNNRNGYIINTALSNTYSSLAILRGHDQNEAETYTHNGRNKQNIAVRTIAKI